MTTTALATPAPTAAPAIAAAPPNFAQPRTMAEIKQVAEVMLASGFFKDLKTTAQACTKMIAGAALGYDAVTSLNAFHIIDGKITPTAGEIGARIKRSGKYNYRVATMTDQEVTLIFMERDGATWMELGPSTFTMQDAIKAGVAGKQVWKSYARNMLFSRALTNAARWYCPDVFGGPVYTPEELGVNVDIVDGEMVVVDVPAASPAAAAAIIPPSRPPSGAEVKALYADVRKLRPDLPEDVKAWAATCVAGYTPPNNPTGKQVLEMHARLTAMLAEGVPAPEPAPAEPPAPTAPPQQAQEAPQTSAEPEPQQELLPPASRPVEAMDSRFPPKHDGTQMSKRTQGAIFALLKDLGVAQDGTESDKRAARLSYAQSYGLDVTSFAELSEPQALWFEKRLRDELICVACHQKTGAGQPHAVDCPEAA